MRGDTERPEDDDPDSHPFLRRAGADVPRSGMSARATPVPRLVRVPCRALLLAALALAPGCFMASVRFDSSVPDAATVAALRPGVTTRAEVLARFGPPDEYRQPTLLSGFELNASAAEEPGLAPAALTWRTELRGDRMVWIFPLFRWSHTDADLRRVVVFFDEQDRVSAIGVDGPTAP